MATSTGLRLTDACMLIARARIDIDGVGYQYFDQLVWAGLATMPGLPGSAIPAGWSPEGLPVAVQLIGPMFEDLAVCRLSSGLALEPGAATDHAHYRRGGLPVTTALARNHVGIDDRAGTPELVDLCGRLRLRYW